jgi:hypothetical protein
MMKSILEGIGVRLARYLTTPRDSGVHLATSRAERLAAALRKGDVLLVEGTSRVSVAIKYLSQSTWSHATLFIGDVLGPPQPDGEAKVLLEADVNEGVRAVPLSAYSGLHTRICRPVGLSREDIDSVIKFAVARIGLKYDLKNIFDLARYLIRTPPVPLRWRRRLIALGSGEPTRAICSTLIAQAFQSIRYPILPEVAYEPSDDPSCAECNREILHIRHHSLFTPRDFDVSPYFQIVKPVIEHGFDRHRLLWGDRVERSERKST